MESLSRSEPPLLKQSALGPTLARDCIGKLDVELHRLRIFVDVIVDAQQLESQAIVFMTVMRIAVLLDQYFPSPFGNLVQHRKVILKSSAFEIKLGMIGNAAK